VEPSLLPIERGWETIFEVVHVLALVATNEAATSSSIGSSETSRVACVVFRYGESNNGSSSERPHIWYVLLVVSS
jgi:hypothetical protein